MCSSYGSRGSPTYLSMPYRRPAMAKTTRKSTQPSLRVRSSRALASPQILRNEFTGATLGTAQGEPEELLWYRHATVAGTAARRAGAAFFVAPTVISGMLRGTHHPTRRRSHEDALPGRAGGRPAAGRRREGRQ